MSYGGIHCNKTRTCGSGKVKLGWAMGEGIASVYCAVSDPCCRVFEKELEEAEESGDALATWTVYV